MIEFILVVIVGITIGIVFAYFYFRTRVELMTRRLGDEIGQRALNTQRAHT